MLGEVWIGPPLRMSTRSTDRWGREVRYFEGPRPGRIPAPTWHNVHRYENYRTSPEMEAAVMKGNAAPLIHELGELLSLSPRRTTLWELNLRVGGDDYVRCIAVAMRTDGCNLREYGLAARVAAWGLRVAAAILNRVLPSRHIYPCESGELN